MRAYLKKTIAVFFIGFLVAALFSLSPAQPERVSIAEASFWDTIIGLVTINPLHVNVSVPSEVNIGSNFKAEVTVENRGEEMIRNLKVELFISEGLVLVSKNAVKEFGALKGNGTKSISWQVQGTEIGNSSVSVSASAEVRGDAISSQGNTALVTVVEKSRFSPPRPNALQRFLSFFRSWF